MSGTRLRATLVFIGMFLTSACRDAPLPTQPRSPDTVAYETRSQPSARTAIESTQGIGVVCLSLQDATRSMDAETFKDYVDTQIDGLIHRLEEVKEPKATILRQAIDALNAAKSLADTDLDTAKMLANIALDKVKVVSVGAALVGAAIELYYGQFAPDLLKVSKALRILGAICPRLSKWMTELAELAEKIETIEDAAEKAAKAADLKKRIDKALGK